MQSTSPPAQLLIAPIQKRADEALKGLRQGGIRNIALVLIELARCKKAARRNQGFEQLIDNGGFADSRIAGNQHQLRPPTGHHTIKRRKKSIDLAASPVQFLRDQQTIRSVVSGQ